MGRWLLVFVLIACPAYAEEDRVVIDGAVDLSFIQADSPYTSWLENGESPLRFVPDHDAFRFSRAFTDIQARLLPTVSFHGTVNIEDGQPSIVDATEAYFEWRPVPQSDWRVRTRVGAFYPRISLENTGIGWSNYYGLSSSAINSWIGEELRTVGAESRISHDLDFLPLPQTISVEGAVFFDNDPAGALLMARGWSIDDRQTGLFGRLPLPTDPVMHPWAPEYDYDAGLQPFKEIDGRPGFYAAAEWQLADRLRLKVFHYDNHANPTAQAGGQYAWATRFDHVGFQAALPADVGLIGQWLAGTTRSGDNLGPWHVWDASFSSWFGMVTRDFGRQRLSFRYDDFDVSPNNDPATLTNEDHGHAWTLSYLFNIDRHLRIGAEYVDMATEHCKTLNCDWVSEGLPRTDRQSVFQLTLRWQFGPVMFGSAESGHDAS